MRWQAAALMSRLAAGSYGNGTNSYWTADHHSECGENDLHDVSLGIA
jgi:hypothetical protein